MNELETLVRMVDAANNEKCDLFVVAGNLFENPRVRKAGISAAGRALKRSESLVADSARQSRLHQEEGDPLWPVFRDAIGDNHLLLRECGVLPAGRLSTPSLPSGIILLYMLCRPSLENQLGGIIQSLMIFKGVTNIYQVTGDPYLPVSTGSNP